MQHAIRSERIVTEQGCFDGIVVVDNGKITGFYQPGQAEITIDARGKVVLPGVIDTHTHIRFPGHPEREDFSTGSAAAAAGGITTILEMPISTPGVRTAAIVRDRMQAARDASIIDVAFYAGGGHGAREQFQAMADAGVVAFKIFLHRPQSGREHEFEGLYTIDDGALLDDLRLLKQTQRVICFHAECDPILEFERKRLESQGRTDYGSHSEAHPVIAEVEAVSRVILFAQETGATVSIKHVTSAPAAQLIKEAKLRGVHIYAETCPHYLFFSNNDLKRYGPYAKINPPLRSTGERDALWEYVLDGTIDYIGTDHAPFTREEKERGRENIFLAPSGIPGFETELPLLLTAVHDGRLSIEQLARLTATNQARIFGIADRKGSIAVGKDADLVIIDPDKAWQLDHKTMVTKSKDIALIYDGIQVYGSVQTTIARGQIVFEHGIVKGQPGRGEVVVPAL
ncbi:MAG: allantoinase AllB [Ktedonobacteraceae bacterium]|nr:allantoinase AllB [Ktedonobacteraceae bacterium]MBO0795918.1 allantoinase AllB [Ktedonobacteraceae bacterium]